MRCHQPRRNEPFNHRNFRKRTFRFRTDRGLMMAIGTLANAGANAQLPVPAAGATGTVETARPPLTIQPMLVGPVVGKHLLKINQIRRKIVLVGNSFSYSVRCESVISRLSISCYNSGKRTSIILKQVGFIIDETREEFAAARE